MSVRPRAVIDDATKNFDIHTIVRRNAAINVVWMIGVNEHAVVNFSGHRACHVPVKAKVHTRNISDE